MLLWILAALLLLYAQAHNAERPLDTVYASVGHLVVLPCDPACQDSPVSWSRDGERVGGAMGVEVKGRQLWFQPAQMAHSGVYTCHYRCASGECEAQMELSVSREKCPYAAANRSLVLGGNGRIPCKLHHVSKASNSTSYNTRWMKGCAPLRRQDSSVDRWGQLRLQRNTAEDVGTYTCFIDVTVGRHKYSAAWSVEVTVTEGPGLVVPHVVYPRDQEVQVHLGGRVQLRCLAELGHSKDSFTHMFWLLNHSYTEEFPQVTESWGICTVADTRVCSEEAGSMPEGQRYQGISTLIISEVHHDLLNVSIICRVKNSVGVDDGQIWLTEAGPSELLSVLAWSLSVCLALLLLTALMTCCRVELVLVYRELRRHSTRHYVDDGRLYDAVVSSLCPTDHAPSELRLLSLQLLPQRLEQQWGYRLYVPGRDDCPGEAMHDALSETVRRSRRLLLLLCPSGQQGALSLSEELQPLCYEQRVGLHDALTRKEPRVILIEIGGPVDYSRLPQSVQYLMRTQGALRWTPVRRDWSSLFLSPERSFWNRLRYHMPAVPSRRRAVHSPSPPPTSLQLCHDTRAAHLELTKTKY